MKWCTESLKNTETEKQRSSYSTRWLQRKRIYQARKPKIEKMQLLMIRPFFHIAHWDTFTENLLNWQKQQNYTKIFLSDTPSLNMKDLKRDSSGSLKAFKEKKGKTKHCKHSISQTHSNLQTKATTFRTSHVRELHRFTESLRLEETSKIISLTNPLSPMSPTKPWP